ncbi:tRNA pseudouridine(38-40) synthase TruA [Candidatus Aerophobetes bacterium]|nr:tRNA pseudouridine(38-40) synthase TruA [Candidatus Aerophobetes bacterium]
MANIKLVLEYEGTNYYGWQIQPNVPTIEGELQNALARILKQRVIITGAARTDRGVHAKGQVVSFKLSLSFPVFQLIPALNSVLSPDIRVKRASQVKNAFHARHSARYKIYRYVICNNFVLHPWLRNFSWWVPFPLNCKLMQDAASYLIGRRDFSSFENKGSPFMSPVRCVQKIKIKKQGSLITVSIKADAFLYKMARNIAGTLVEVGRGRFSPLDVRNFLLTKDRRKAGPTAPPQGLFLWRVGYDRDIFDKNSW